MADLGQVRHIDLVRQLLATGRTHADQRHAAGQGPGRQRQLGAALVAGVDQHIDRGREQAGPVVGAGKFFNRQNFAARVDVGNALPQCLNLGQSQGAAQRLHLAVDVGLGHLVKIDQHQPRHTAARQRFDRPGAHTAQADHRDPRCAHPLVTRITVQPTQAAKASFQVGIEPGACRQLGGQRLWPGSGERVRSQAARSMRQTCQRSAATAPAMMAAVAMKLPSDSVDKPDKP